MTTIADLLALSEKATPGPYKFVSGDTIVGYQSHPVWKLTEPVHRQLSGYTGQDGEFVPALVNWFRANAARLAAMEKNDARYRWLRDAPDVSSVLYTAIPQKRWDAVIDAALASTEGKP